jgi:hypothetical protein
VVGWCKGELLFSVIQVGACMIGSLCFHLVGSRNTQGFGASFYLVLEKSGSWCFLLVGARETRELVLPSSGC